MQAEIGIVEDNNALTLPDPDIFLGKLQEINKFQNIVHANLIPNQDFGVIPGTMKPTLLKPGAEKIAKLLNLADEYEIMDKIEDWDRPLFHYTIKCLLRHIGSGIVVSEGVGECNSMEAKYRWRESKRVCPICGASAIIKGKEQYGGGWLCFKKMGGCGKAWPDGAPEIVSQQVGQVENEDIYSQVNTILKMAKKRALVDAALSAGRLSNIFTQDMEDIATKPVVSKPAKAAKKAEAPMETVAAPVNDNLTLGSIRSALSAKGYKTEVAQRDIMAIKEWGEITDYEGALVYIDSLE